MIVRKSQTGTALCITQLHHSSMTGAIANAWRAGDEIPEIPEPCNLVVQAALLHDLGWLDWESSAALDSNGHPFDFLKMPKHHHFSIWKNGFEDACQVHPLVGLLVLRHNLTLAQSGNGNATDDDPELTAFLNQTQQPDALLEAHLLRDVSLPNLSTESLRDMNAFVLLADYISLRMCMGPEKESPFGPPPPFRGLGLQMEPDPSQLETFRISPWPFEGDRLVWEATAWQHPQHLPFEELQSGHQIKFRMELRPA